MMSSSNILHYRLASHRPRAHLFDLSLTLPASQGLGLRLRLPAWIPGSYKIRDFARHVITLSAEDASGPIAVEKQDKHTWHLPETRGSVQIHYHVYAGELSVRAAHLDHTHGFFNGACLLLCPEGYEHWPCQLDIDRPADPCAAQWRVATSLTPAGAAPWDFGRYQAENYAALIDHPVEMGLFERIEFQVRNIPHAMVISGQAGVDHERLGRDLARICKQQARLFNALPIERYLFLTQVVAEGYGGLEHRASCSLICAREDLPRPGEPEVTDSYRRFLGLCSHEYFHLWNVKRIRPQVFAEQGLEREVHTRLLWAFEGITSYYDDLALVRAGVISPVEYLDLLAKTLSRVQRDPGRLHQTVSESSFDAWTKFYQQDANAPNAIVSYYAKGAMVALALDLTLRHATAGRFSLDDVMRALWQRHGRTGLGVPERAIEALCAELTGLNLDAFFSQALDSTTDLDLTPLLATLGIQLRLRPARDGQDLGGALEQFDPLEPQSAIGVRFQPKTSEARLAVVLNDRPAEQAGLAPGDVIIAIDGLQVQASTVERQLARCPIGEPVAVHAFRGDRLHTFAVIPQPAPAELYELRLIEDAPTPAKQARAAWLHTTALALGLD